MSTSDENPFLAVIRVWAAVAWADDVLVEAEAEAMRRLIAVAPLDEGDKATALGWLRSKVELDTTFVKTLARDQRHGIYRAAVRMVRIDRNVAPEETAFLGRLRVGLEMSEAEAEAVERAVVSA